MKGEPVWISPRMIHHLHGALLARFGGLDGVREPGLLEAALDRPKNRFAYENAGLFELAASYAHGIVKNHAFLDGNKRTALMAAYTFLGMNGFVLVAPEVDAVLKTVALAAGDCSEAEYAAWLRENSRPAA